VVFGLALLIIGLVVYTSIPAVHTTPLTRVSDVWVQGQFPVQGNSLVEEPRNVTIFSGMGNELRTNLTVKGPSGTSSSIHFQLLGMNKSQTCSPYPQAPSILLDRIASNQSFFVVPLNMTGTYCFVFDNQASQQMKDIDISAQVSGATVQVQIARDGNANTAGLGLGAIGLVVAVYGYSRKTVIPWE
jgi:hypothetical protein